MKKTLTQQDDCAPDSLEYFDKRFEKILGCTRKEFKNKSVYTSVDDGYSHYWRFENYILEIHADDPYYKLSIEE